MFTKKKHTALTLIKHLNIFVTEIQKKTYKYTILIIKSLLFM